VRNNIFTKSSALLASAVAASTIGLSACGGGLSTSSAPAKPTTTVSAPAVAQDPASKATVSRVEAAISAKLSGTWRESDSQESTQYYLVRPVRPNGYPDPGFIAINVYQNADAAAKSVAGTSSISAATVSAFQEGSVVVLLGASPTLDEVVAYDSVAPASAFVSPEDPRISP
jgi:hypothetical protein